MQATVEDLGQLKRSIAIEIPLEEIRETYDDVLRQVKSLRLRGFRPGKLPKTILDKRFKEAMTMHALERVVPKYYGEALKERGIEPATQPALDDLAFDLRKPLTFKVNFEVKPVPPPINYGRLRLEDRPLEPSAEEVEREFQEVIDNHSEFVKRASDGPAAEGDHVRVNVSSTPRAAEGQPREQEGMVLRVGDGLLSEVRQNLAGMRVGETRSFEVALKDGPADTILTLVELLDRQEPAMDEGFFKGLGPNLGPVNSEAELREAVAKLIRKAKVDNLRKEYHAALREQLPEAVEDFPLPEGLMAEFLERAKKDIEAKGGLDAEGAAAELAAAEKKIRAELKLDFILDNIGKAESIKADNEGTFRQYWEFVRMLGKNPMEYVKTEEGTRFYQRMLLSSERSACLDFIAERVLGKKVFPLPDYGPDEEDEDDHDHDHHDHDHHDHDHAHHHHGHDHHGHDHK